MLVKGSSFKECIPHVRFGFQKTVQLIEKIVEFLFFLKETQKRSKNIGKFIIIPVVLYILK